MSPADPAPLPGAPASPPRAPRFSWPMRLFLSFVVFHILFRSLSVLLPYTDWTREFDMRRKPVRLATAKERAELAARATPGEPDPVWEDVMLSLDSVWEFFKPWPEERARKKVRTWPDRGKFVVCWLNSRLEFLECLLGVNEDWPMFSPNVSRRKYLTRARLLYADHSERIVRNHGDPEDLTRYHHWFEEKILDHELKVSNDPRRVDECLGYCNLLAHRYARNENGSPLVKIRLFEVRYDFPPPGIDPQTFLAAQNGPPDNQVYDDYYEYDVASRHGKRLSD